ncbi:hypothetical protein [Corynebacterium heidelbergense]|uniref:hypothetical protein n=1 Tax=Corynebacterium heidelbergense TaxID=2055947 RepID=UPI0011BF2EC5|nr:hypothetical protein [Corynebacterium heidelbergense]WCZ37019.1 hypothetical protein CHEID_07430 [Corynebacterium heidelbergense]
MNAPQLLESPQFLGPDVRARRAWRGGGGARGWWRPTLAVLTAATLTATVSACGLTSHEQGQVSLQAVDTVHPGPTMIAAAMGRLVKNQGHCARTSQTRDVVQWRCMWTKDNINHETTAYTNANGSIREWVDGFTSSQSRDVESAEFLQAWKKTVAEQTEVLTRLVAPQDDAAAIARELSSKTEGSSVPIRERGENQNVSARRFNDEDDHAPSPQLRLLNYDRSVGNIDKDKPNVGPNLGLPIGQHKKWCGSIPGAEYSDRGQHGMSVTTPRSDCVIHLADKDARTGTWGEEPSVYDMEFTLPAPEKLTTFPLQPNDLARRGVEWISGINGSDLTVINGILVTGKVTAENSEPTACKHARLVFGQPTDFSLSW